MDPSLTVSNNNFENQNWNYNNPDLQTNFPDNHIAYQDENAITQSPDQWSQFSPQQFLMDIPVPANSEGGQTYQRYSSLGLEEELALREIAMPSQIPIQSMEELAIKRESSTSTSTSPPITSSQISRDSSKRRRLSMLNSTVASSEEEEEEEQASRSLETLHKKKGHNAIEKRYRTNLNDKIQILDQCLPQPIPEEGELVSTFQGSIDERRKNTKSAILTRAVEHIGLLEQNARRLKLETAALNTRIAAFEKLALSGITQPVLNITEGGIEEN